MRRFGVHAAVALFSLVYLAIPYPVTGFGGAEESLFLFFFATY